MAKPWPKKNIKKPGVVLKKIAPPLPSEHQGWNAGKGDCGHYRSHLDFSILMGRGFIGIVEWWAGLAY